MCQRAASVCILMFAWVRGSYHFLSCRCPSKFRSRAVRSRCAASPHEDESKMSATTKASKQHKRLQKNVPIFLSKADIQLRVCVHQRDLLCRLLYPCLILLEYQWETSETWRFEEYLTYIITRLVNPVVIICVDHYWHWTGGHQVTSTLYQTRRVRARF